MNNHRRAKLREAISMLSAATNMVETASYEEQDCLDNLPENLQETDRAELMENAVDNLEDAVEKIDEAKNLIQSAIA